MTFFFSFWKSSQSSPRLLLWVGKIASRLNQRKKNARRRHSKQIQNDSGSNPIRIRFESDSSPVVVQPRKTQKKKKEKESASKRSIHKNAKTKKHNASTRSMTRGSFKDCLWYCWSPRVRRRPLSEISLWSTGSPMSWRVSQTPECSGLLTATRGFCVIDPQRQPGKFKKRRRKRENQETSKCDVRSGRVLQNKNFLNH